MNQVNNYNINNNFGEFNPNEIIEGKKNKNRQFNLGKDKWANDLK